MTRRWDDGFDRDAGQYEGGNTTDQYRVIIAFQLRRHVAREFESFKLSPPRGR